MITKGKSISTRISLHYLKLLNKWSKKFNKSVSEFVRDATHEKLDNLEK